MLAAVAPMQAVRGTMGHSSILWGRLDREGTEVLAHASTARANELHGCALFVHEERPCRIAYHIRCDARWRTTAVRIDGSIGDETVEHAASVDAHGRWTFDGAERPDLEGCADIDLEFSPSTNTLPIRRLALAVGGSASVRAAWLRFPSFALEPLAQVYTRLDDRRYRYESGGGAFVAEIEVDAQGFVVNYPGFWQRCAAR